LDSQKKLASDDGGNFFGVPVVFLARNRVIKALLGFVISIYCIYLLQNQITTLPDNLNIGAYRIDLLVLSIFSAFLSQLGRAMRWSKFIKISGFKIKNTKLLDAYFKSILANNLLPLRVGDILRATYYGQRFTGSRVTGTILIISEKMLDTAVLLLVIGIAFYGEGLDYVNRHVDTFGFTEMVLFVSISTILLLFLYCTPKAKKLILKCIEISKGIQVGTSEKISLALYTFVIWNLEALSFYFAIQSLGMEITYFNSLVLMTIVTLSTSIPSTPGYFGTFHLVFIEALSVLDSTSSNSFVAAVSVHLILWMTSNLVGTWYVVNGAWKLRSGKAKR
jgi:uncharacterized membrane protein YbhN (UPF0104 family)